MVKMHPPLQVECECLQCVSCLFSPPPPPDEARKQPLAQHPGQFLRRKDEGEDVLLPPATSTASRRKSRRDKKRGAPVIKVRGGTTARQLHYSAVYITLLYPWC